MASLDKSGLRCADTWSLGRRIDPSPVDDDHPFPYLRTRSIPPLYRVTIAATLLASLLLIRGVAGPLAQMRGELDLFFMGAAFLLLETKNVVQFSLLFGATWLVNALVFFGILVSVFAAVEIARHVRVSYPRRLYMALFAALALAWVVPPESLLSLSLAPRFAAAVLLAFFPIFLANLVFAERFRTAASSTVSLGANLIGAMLGGILEYSSLILGYRSLLVVIALLYGLAFLLGHKHIELGDADTLQNEKTGPAYAT